ncbi:MAG: hypothetical protein M1835_001789 [Candelina submexicana]|nr:MAG: hypothetical protein M1835_001789 [Candelina submexicana]
MDDWYDCTDFAFCFAACCFRKKNHTITPTAIVATAPPVAIPAIAPPLMDCELAAAVGDEPVVDTAAVDGLLGMGTVFMAAAVVVALLPPNGVGPPLVVEFSTVLVYPVLAAHPKPIEPDEYTYCAHAAAFAEHEASQEGPRPSKQVVNSAAQPATPLVQQPTYVLVAAHV